MNNKRGREGQSAIEFFIIVGAVLMFFIAFMYAVQVNIGDKTVERKFIVTDEIAKNVQKELVIASDSADGYYREFLLSPTIINQDYTIGIDDGVVHVKSDDERYTASYPVVEVQGDPVPGNNVVTKFFGVVCLNVDKETCLGTDSTCGNGMYNCVDDDSCDAENEKCIENSGVKYCVEVNLGGQPLEDCDDGPGGGPAGDNDLCTNACELAYCGDGIVCSDFGTCNPWEACDDGNQIYDDGCDPDCTESSGEGSNECGNGLWEFGEDCDYASYDSRKDCSGVCELDCTCNELRENECNVEGSASPFGEICIGKLESGSHATYDSCADGASPPVLYSNNIWIADGVGYGFTVTVVCEVCCNSPDTKWRISHYGPDTGWKDVGGGSCEEYEQCPECSCDNQLHYADITLDDAGIPQYIRCTVADSNFPQIPVICPGGFTTDADDIEIDMPASG
jgi:cysteine-rich repeat protein